MGVLTSVFAIDDVDGVVVTESPISFGDEEGLKAAAFAFKELRERNSIKNTTNLIMVLQEMGLQYLLRQLISAGLSKDVLERVKD